ncbi:MAG TPA: hypothetical protein VGC39_05770 [Candidatus Methylacidiphilales bacterium]
MTTSWRMLTGSLLLLASAVAPSCAVELKVSRDVLQRTLKQQLFSGPNGRYYLKGTAQTPCFVYADDAQLNFVQDRVVVVIKAHAKLGKTFRNSCLGISLDSAPQVSLAPIGEGETIGFRDARLDKVVDQKELNFFITPFLSHQLPSSMKINAADLLRKSLTGATAATGFKVTLDKLNVHSMHTQGDDLVVDVDGDISVR